MKQLELSTFLQYRFLSELNFSPDGKQAALVVASCDTDRNAYESAIWLYKNGGFMKLTGLNKERGYVWEDDTHILFPAARSEKEQEQLKNGDAAIYYRISTEGGEAAPAITLPFAGSLVKKLNENVWICAGTIDPAYPDFYKMTEEEKADIRKKQKEEEDYEVLTTIPFYFNGAGFTKGMVGTLYTYDTEKKEAKRIAPADVNAGEPVVLNGKIYYTGSPVSDVMQMDAEEIYVYDPETDETKKLTNTPGYSVYLAENVNGTLVACLEESTKWHISPEAKFYTVDIESGEVKLLLDNTDNLFNTTGSDCRFGGSHEVRSANGALYVIKTMRNEADLYKLSTDGVMTPVIEKAGSVDDFAIAPDGTVLVTAMYDGKLQEVYAVENGEAKKLSAFNDEVLKDVYVAEYNKMTIESRGWDIDGWVLLPKDYDETRTYPAIIDIHGGPRTVYGEIFYHEMQLWANMGYFVFFCNPVGGAGRGQKFADITDAYGTIDFDNLMDFTDAVLEKYPQIDRKRVGCTGGSYGGFMSNWILGHTDRFAAIATQRSISNWISFYGVSDIGYFFVKNQLGHDIRSDEGLKRIWDQSPLKYINNMVTPTLFIHSNEDYRCPMEQGMQLYTALKEKGVPTRFVYFKGENHELSRSGKPLHRKKRLQEITDWMEKYVKG